MSGRSTTGWIATAEADPAAVVMRHLAAAEDLPTLEDLDRGVLAACRDLPHVEAVSIVTETQGAGLLDPTRGRRCQASLGEWTQAGDEALHHLSTTLHVKGRPFATIRLGVNVPSADAREAAAALERLVAVVEPAAGLWADAVAGRAEVRTVRTENRALSQLNRLQGRFAAMTSHELKTPLTSITAYSDVLAGMIRTEDHPQAGEFLDVIRQESTRLLRMVNRILDFSRLDGGRGLLESRPTDLRVLVEEAVRSLQPMILGKDLQCTVEAEPELPQAVVDADLIRQVLVNLLGNAIKYTPTGGRVEIRLREEESTVAVSIADTGPGIPQDDLRRIFREFYRSPQSAGQEEGSGLGLTIARHIVHLHDGSIGARRRRGGGSEFTFRVAKEMIFPADLPAAYGGGIHDVEALHLIRSLLQLMTEATGSRTAVLLLPDREGELLPVAATGLPLRDGRPVRVTRDPAWMRFLAAGEAVHAAAHPDLTLPWTPSAAESDLLMVPTGGGEAGGCLVLGRRILPGGYTADEQVQLSVLAGILRPALAGVADIVGQQATERPGSRIGRITEAVRGLLQIRRTGVPTASSEALRLAGLLGRGCRLDENEVRRLQFAAALHDAGMARIEDEILLGETDLSWDERDEVAKHVEQGVDILEPLLPDAELGRIIRHHHERMDGSGYPDGLGGARIPLGSRLLSVIDAWFSLTRGRPYRPGIPPTAALAEIREHGGSQFDPDVVNEFERILRREGLLNGVPDDLRRVDPGA